MLKQASVKQIRSGELTRKHGYIAVTMCFYPRGLRKELRDEYRKNLAPDSILFKEWQVFEKTYGHEQAFVRSSYEDRFTLSPAALDDLFRLADLSRKQDVYVICQCAVGERCHREILMLEAKRLFRAPIDKVFHSYPRYLARFEKA